MNLRNFSGPFATTDTESHQGEKYVETWCNQLQVDFIVSENKNILLNKKPSEHVKSKN